MSKYEDKEMCANCGGECCKTIPGAMIPADVGKPFYKNLVSLLSSGNYSIDHWSGDPRLKGAKESSSEQSYYLRPRTKEKPYGLFDHSFGGECIFLSKRGCQLPFEKRPHSCRRLIPRKNGKCKYDHSDVMKAGGVGPLGGNRVAAIKWRRYKHWLLKAEKESYGQVITREAIRRSLER